MPGIMVDVDQRERYFGNNAQSISGVVGMDQEEGDVGDDTLNMRGVATWRCLLTHCEIYALLSDGKCMSAGEVTPLRTRRLATLLH